MDGCGWLIQADAGSCGGAGLLHHKEEEGEVIGSQALSQIYMLLDTEEHSQYDVPVLVPAPAPRHASLPSSSSSSFRSLSGSRDDNSPSLMLTAASTTTSCHHTTSRRCVSSQIPLSPVTYDAVHRQHTTSGSLGMPSMDGIYYQEAHQQQACYSRIVHGTAATACAFRPYARCLGQRKKLKPRACGQRAIKTAMSVLARMHMAKFAQCYRMESMAAQAPPPAAAAGTACNQLQHALSERKRREKLNDSFKALMSVLPPASKKDRTSILIRAKDYVNNLKSRVSELEEKNRMLVESELHSKRGRSRRED